MRALKALTHHDHRDPEELAGNERTGDENKCTSVDTMRGPPKVKTHALFGNKRTRVDAWGSLSNADSHVLLQAALLEGSALAAYQRRAD